MGGLLKDPDFVVVFDFDFAAASPGGADFDLVVVADGAFVADGEADDDEEDAVLFELGVADAGLSEQFGPADFEPGGVGGVVGDAHGVALVVADAEAMGALVDAQARGVGGVWGLRGVETVLVVHKQL